MKQLTTTQKKKIWYSLLGVAVIALIIGISFMLWDNIPNVDWEHIKTRIVTSLTAYLSLLFLGFKVVWFFSVELAKKKKRAKEITDEIIKESEQIMSKTKIKTPKSSEMSFTFEGQNFTCKLNGFKEINITAKNGFTSSQDFYNKIRVDLANFRDYIGKVISGDIEIKK